MYLSGEYWLNSPSSRLCYCFLISDGYEPLQARALLELARKIGCSKVARLENGSKKSFSKDARLEIGSKKSSSKIARLEIDRVKIEKVMFFVNFLRFFNNLCNKSLENTFFWHMKAFWPNESGQKNLLARALLELARKICCLN